LVYRKSLFHFPQPFDATPYQLQLDNIKNYLIPSVVPNNNNNISSSLPNSGYVQFALKTKAAPVVEEEKPPEVALKPALPTAALSRKTIKMTKLKNLPVKGTEEDEENAQEATVPATSAIYQTLLHYEDPQAASLPNKEMRALFLNQRSYFAINPVFK
jgi:hypothetical protein